ncbi:MAG: hypothetical protein IPO30_12955 [Hyphomonadaceae bacterium]|nr:hypothetical protein [Hyphomonadaceae bacterium]
MQTLDLGIYVTAVTTRTASATTLRNITAILTAFLLWSGRRELSLILGGGMA